MPRASRPLGGDGNTRMATTLSATQLAEKLHTDPRTARRFLRSPNGLDLRVGRGARWEIQARDVRKLKGRFEKWSGGQGHAEVPDFPNH